MTKKERETKELAAARKVVKAARKQAYMGQFISGAGRELQDALQAYDATIK